MPEEPKTVLCIQNRRPIDPLNLLLLGLCTGLVVTCTTHSQPSPPDARTEVHQTQLPNSQTAGPRATNGERRTGEKSLKNEEQSPTTTPLNELLIRVLPEVKGSAPSFDKSTIGQRLKRITGREPTPQDTQALIALRALLVAQRELREDRPAQAKELAKFILATQHLSTHLYVFALRYLVLADAILLTKPITTNLPLASLPGSDPKTDFNSFQSLQCAIACKTHGWQVVAHEEPALLSPQGYKTKLLSSTVFKSERLTQPDWVKNLFTASAPSPKKDQSDDIDSSVQVLTKYQRVLKLRSLVDNRQWTRASNLAKKILNERPSQVGQNLTTKTYCPSDRIIALYTLAQSARIAQDRRTFARLQESLVQEIDRNSGCLPRDFVLEKEQFDSFRLDNLLWLARLQWEQNKNPDAFFSSRKVADTATALQSWDHFVDATKVMVGRIGYEMLTLTENLALLDALEKGSSNIDSEEFYVWLNSRRGLLHYLDGNFDTSVQFFERVIQNSSDSAQRAMAFYWIGRAHQTAKKASEGENAFLSAGMTDPLGIYDIFSGQLLTRESGRASTSAKQAFYSNWKDEHESWLQISETRPLKIASSVPPRTRFNLHRDPGFEANLVSQQQFDLSLETSILFIALLKATMNDMTIDDFSSYLQQSEDVIPSYLRAETQQLRQSFQRLNTLHSEVLPRAHQVAWLTHVVGDHSNAILFVGRLRDTLGWDTDYLPFLYFIFYPRPYLRDFEAAANRCSIDIDLLYALSRQESLFQAAVKSPVGAIGLMQLLPTTAARILKKFPEFNGDPKPDLTLPATNTLAGACYLKQLLDRYDNNLTFAIAAYNAGEAAVDRWIEKRQKIADMPLFIEFIPYAETKTYVQRVLRNYYNLKWIYRSRANEKENAQN